MDLGNLSNVIMHYLLIRGMTCLGHRDGFPMTNALMCIVIHWTRPTMNDGIG